MELQRETQYPTTGELAGIAIDIDSPGEAGDMLESVSLHIPMCYMRE